MLQREQLADRVWSDERFGPFLRELSSDSLEIRAAANASVSEEKRPIKKRVLRRVVSSAEFKRTSASIIASMVGQLGGPATTEGTADVLLPKAVERFQDSEQLSEDFFERLSKDREFSTLILEAVERERRWADLLQKDFKSFRDWLQSLLEKFSSPNHPVSRTVSAVLLSGISLGITYKVAVSLDQKQFTIPVRVQLEGANQAISVALIPNGLSQTIPIRFTASDPVNLDLQVASPLAVQLVQANPPLVVRGGGDVLLENLAAELKSLNTFIGTPRALQKLKGDQPSETLIGAAQ
jgi:hypothetical protein